MVRTYSFNPSIQTSENSNLPCCDKKQSNNNDNYFLLTFNNKNVNQNNLNKYKKNDFNLAKSMANFSVSNKV